MVEFNNANQVGKYDTSINVIGGLKDVSVIYKAITAHFNDKDTLNNLILDRNEFNLRTEKSRMRIEKAIDVSFLRFKNQDHSDLIQSIFSDRVHLQDKQLILFWQFALCNRLFYDISTQVFMKVYFSGRTHLSKDDIMAYLKEFLAQNKQLNLKWSEITISTLVTKYLNLMTKFNFLEGARTKAFRNIKPSAESLVLFLYFAKLYDSENNNILTNSMLPLAFLEVDDFRERLKKLSLKGFFNMNFNGIALNIELTHSYKGICDVLYR
jgi:Putative inner membrane protein (DUF1819)